MWDFFSFIFFPPQITESQLIRSGSEGTEWNPSFQNLLGCFRHIVDLETRGEKRWRWRHTETAEHAMRKRHSNWILDTARCGERCLPLYTVIHTHMHTHNPWYIVLSIWATFLSSRKSSPGCHVTLWSIMKASSWSLFPFISTDHHSPNTLAALHWSCTSLSVLVCVWSWTQACGRYVKRDLGIQVDIRCAFGYWQNDDEDKTNMCRQQRANLFKAFFFSFSWSCEHHR